MSLLTSAASSTSSRAILSASIACISSAGLHSGTTHSTLPCGVTSRCGLGRPLASRGPELARDLASPIPATSGLSGSVSSRSADLSASVASRLRVQLATSGSTLYKLTWKDAVMPSGRSYCLLRASGLRTSGTGAIGSQTDGWLTPRANENDQGSHGEIAAAGSSWLGQGRGATVATMAHMAGWPTPAAIDATSNSERPDSKASRGSGGINLNTAARVAGWPTPKAEDAESTGFSAKRLEAGKIPDNLHSASKLAGWATPHAGDHRPGHPSRMTDTNRVNLMDQALVAGWVTPSATDTKGANNPEHPASKADLPTQAGGATPSRGDYRTPPHQTRETRDGVKAGERLEAQTAHVIPGASLSGSDASTESRGLLNLRFSAWLQGIPPEWDLCAPRPAPKARKNG